MTSIFNEISKLRKGQALAIDYKNSNRYRIVALEPNGSKTAYYFSTPIYNNQTRKALDMSFHKKGEAICAVGSNASITIAGAVKMENTEGSCIIPLADKISFISEHELACGNERLYPTTNGIAIRTSCQDGKQSALTFELSKPFMEVRANDKYFALMSEKFRPFFTVSCIGTTDASQSVISPAKLRYQKITDRKYTLSFAPCSSIGKSILLEVNLYEPKLFQDTTVESNHPKLNNAFGSIGFIGTTKEFGEQWLYSRPDFTKMPEMNDKKMIKAVLHLPRLNNSTVELSTSKVSARFCSFGSTWNNKVAEAAASASSVIADSYIDIDLMSMLADKQGKILKSEGIILKTKKKGVGFSVIATGDNYLTPQILEINYR